MAKSLLSRKRTRNFISDLNISDESLNPDENVLKFGWENIQDFRINGTLYCIFDMSSSQTSSLGIHYKSTKESDCVILIVNFVTEQDGYKTIRYKKLFLKERLKEVVYYSAEQIFFGYSSSQSRIIIYSHIDKHISKLNSLDCEQFTHMKFIKSISCLVIAGKGFVYLYKYLNHSLHFLKQLEYSLKENEQIIRMNIIQKNKLFILTEERLLVWSFATKGHHELIRKRNSLSNILEYDENTFNTKEKEDLRNSINEELFLELPNNHNSELSCGLVSTKHRLIFTGSTDGSILVWSLEKNESKSYIQLHELTGHLAQITGLELDPSGKFLLSTSSDGYCQAWFIEMSQTVYKVPLNERALSISHIFENIYYIKIDNGILFYRFYFNAIPFYTLNASCVYLKKLNGFMNNANRLISIQQNGTLSLHSPVYGAPILQINQPDLKHEEIINIVRNAKNSVFYVLLNSGKIIVANELTEIKPMYLIMAEKDQDKITSIEIVKMSEALGYAQSSDDYFLLFFGHSSGDISLINTYNVRMTPVKAHLGAVCQIVSSYRGHTENKSIKSDVSLLISFGLIDKTIKLWKIRYISSAQYVELINVFELMIEQTCFSLYMIKNCLAFVTNESSAIKSIEFDTHDTDHVSWKFVKYTLYNGQNKHKNNIICLDGCIILELFVTNDIESIKFWSKDCINLKTICFSNSVDRVLFNNVSGDLLIVMKDTKTILILYSNYYLTDKQKSLFRLEYATKKNIWEYKDLCEETQIYKAEGIREMAELSMLQNYLYSVQNHKTQLPLGEWEVVMMDLIAVQKSSSLHDKSQNEKALKRKLRNTRNLTNDSDKSQISNGKNEEICKNHLTSGGQVKNRNVMFKDD